MRDEKPSTTETVEGVDAEGVEGVVADDGALGKEVLGLDEDALDDYAIVEDGFLDMDEQLIELLELEFPRKILCRPDCRGLCPKCGRDLNTGDCDCREEPDPRWAPLQAILDEMEARDNSQSEKTE